MSAADCCTTLLSSAGEGHTNSHDLSQDNADGDSIMLLEPRPFRPFKTSEEYLYAMREDLAEWLHNLYNLDINVDNFFEILETGEVLCGHANNVRRLAEELRQQQQHDQLQGPLQDLNHTPTPGRKYSSKWEIPPYDVHYRSDVTQGSFFARDNIHNFITWCRDLGIHEVLLFETDDLVLRKNEKHVILSLLEVARRGARFGMAAPLLVQMEADIDRELEQERLAEERMAESGGQFNEDEAWANGGHDLTPPEPPKVFYGPQAQIITNDLKSLDEMVRDLVERCSCPSQFPMVKVSEGKYRIGDTKVLIFVRILRNHVMVRVGGGWDTLEHYLDKHDPCRCRQGHRVALGSRVGFKTSNSGQDRQLMNVTYDSKKTANGHTLSVQTTTVRLTQQEALREGRRMIEEGLKSRKGSLDPSIGTKMPPKTEFTVEVKPFGEKRSSSGIGDKFLSHSEVEKQVLASLARIESEASSANTNNSLTVKHRRKSLSTRDLGKTVAQKSGVKSPELSGDRKLDFSKVTSPIQRSPKKLVKAKSSLSLTSSTTSSPKDETSLKKNTAHTSESSQQIASSKQKNSEVLQNSKTYSGSMLKSGNPEKSLKSSSNTSSPQRRSAACTSGKSKISVQVHQASLITEELEPALPINAVPTQISAQNGNQESKMAALKTKNALRSQIQNSNSSSSVTASQNNKSDRFSDVSPVKEHGNANKILSPSSKRLAELSSPKKVPRGVGKTQDSSQGKTSKLGSNYKSRPYSNTECDPPFQQKDKLPRSKIPVSTNSTSPVKHPCNYNNRLPHKGKDPYEKHLVPEKIPQNQSLKNDLGWMKNGIERAKQDNCFNEEDELNNVLSSEQYLEAGSRSGGPRE